MKMAVSTRSSSSEESEDIPERAVAKRKKKNLHLLMAAIVMFLIGAILSGLGFSTSQSVGLGYVGVTGMCLGAILLTSLFCSNSEADGKDGDCEANRNNAGFMYPAAPPERNEGWTTSCEFHLKSPQVQKVMDFDPELEPGTTLYVCPSRNAYQAYDQNLCGFMHYATHHKALCRPDLLLSLEGSLTHKQQCELLAEDLKKIPV